MSLDFETWFKKQLPGGNRRFYDESKRSKEGPMESSIWRRIAFPMTVDILGRDKKEQDGLKVESKYLLAEGPA